MRLINAEILAFDIKVKRDWLDTSGAVGRGEYIALNKALAIIDEQPTIDAVEVVRGTWTVDRIDEYELSYGSTGYEPVYRCSRCGHVTESYLRLDRPIMPEDADFTNYCPNCGAKMEGEVKRDDNT